MVNANRRRKIIKNTFTRNRTICLTICIFIFALLFNISLINNSGNFPGLSVLILEIFFLIVSFFFLKNKSKKNSTKKIDYKLYIAVLYAVLIAIWYTIFTNYFFAYFFAYLLIHLNIYIVLYIQDKNQNLFLNLTTWLLTYINSASDIFGTFSISVKEIKSLFTLKKISFFNDYFKNNKENFKHVFTGIWLFLILLWIIIPLLTSADKVFNKYIVDFFNLLSYINLDFLNNLTIYSFIFNYIFITLLVFLFIFSLYIYIPNLYKIKEIVIVKKNINNIIPNIVIYGLNIVYLLFTIIQFKYIFFGSQTQFQNLDITYSSYIHEGFYQLLIVAFINFILYSYFYKRHTLNNKEVFSLLSKIKFILLLLFTIVISYSALTRIFLYIDAYNFTIQRFFVIYITILILILFIVHLIYIISGKNNYIKYYYYLAMLSFIGMGYFNIESYVAKYNIEKYQAGETKFLDESYIYGLGNDVIEYKLQALVISYNIKKRSNHKDIHALLHFARYGIEVSQKNNLPRYMDQEIDIIIKSYNQIFNLEYTNYLSSNSHLDNYYYNYSRNIFLDNFNQFFIIFRSVLHNKQIIN